MRFLIPPHPLINLEIQEYYQNEPRFNDVYSRNNLPKTIKDSAYLINLGEYADVGTHLIAFFCNRSEIAYVESFGVEHVPEEIKKFDLNKNIIANIFRVQANNSIMCGYFCIGFIVCFLPRNGNIILCYFKDLKLNEINKINLPEHTKFPLS